MNANKKTDKKVLIFTAAALVAAVCAIWLLFAPRIEKERVADAQESMIEDLMRDINGAEETTEEFTETPELTVTESIEYTEDYGDFEDETAEQEPESVNIAVYEHIFSDPIDDNIFPEQVIGIGILTIESIDLRLPVAEGIESDSLRIAPGRVPQTAQIGDIGNAVIAGHRNYAYGSMFNRLDELEIGDIVQYQARNGELMEFVVFEIAVIEPENQIAFLQPSSESIITLYTCTPVRVASHRLIIRARRVAEPINTSNTQQEEVLN